MFGKRAGGFLAGMWVGGCGKVHRRAFHYTLCILFLAGFLAAAVEAQPAISPDFSQIGPVDADSLTLEELAGSLGGAMGFDDSAHPSGDQSGSPALQFRRSTANSSNAPPVCNGPYVYKVRPTYCRELVPNNNYMAVFTARFGPTAATGDDVQAWLNDVDGSFQLAWSSNSVPTQSNASNPYSRYKITTSNATNAPADLHVFFRPVGLGIERVIDSLVRQRVGDWYFSPLSKIRSHTGSEGTFHIILRERVSATAGPWPATDFRQLIPRIQAVIPSQDRVERHTVRLGGTESFHIYPSSRNAFDRLEMRSSLESVQGLVPSLRARMFILPGDQAPVGGPSGGGGGAGATAVPLSTPFGQALLALVLALAAVYWMRRS